MKVFTLILMSLVSSAVLANECHVQNTVTTKQGMSLKHSSSKLQIIKTDIQGCLNIVQEGYLINEHFMSEGAFSVQSAAFFYGTDELGIQDKKEHYLAATSKVNTKGANCSATYKRKVSIVNPSPKNILINAEIERRTSLDAGEECIAKTGLEYLKVIEDNTFDNLEVSVRLKSKTQRAFTLKASLAGEFGALKRILSPLILKLNH